MLENGKFTFKTSSPIELVLIGTAAGNSMSGEITLPQGRNTFSGTKAQ
jgi:hypothetical protein